MESKHYFEMLWQVEEDKTFTGCMNIDFYIPAAITYSEFYKRHTDEPGKNFWTSFDKVLHNPQKAD